MAAKMSIKDVARTLELPLADSNYLTKLVPDKPGTSLRHVFDMDLDTLKQKGYNSDDIGNIQKLRKLIEGNDLQSKILKEARLLEGSRSEERRVGKECVRTCGYRGPRYQEKKKKKWHYK